MMPALIALGQVLLIDLVLAGDNAVVVGMAVAGLPAEQKNRAILIGIGAATLFRIGFALITVQLLAIVGLLLVGGILLLYVCWKMYREIREHNNADDALSDAERAPKKGFWQAMIQIIIADVSMSLDNVLAVAGAAREHVGVLVIGLLISVVLMGAAATLIARVLNKYRFIAWIGLAVILFVALRMIYEGSEEVACAGILPALCMAH